MKHFHNIKTQCDESDECVMDKACENYHHCKYIEDILGPTETVEIIEPGDEYL